MSDRPPPGALSTAVALNRVADELARLVALAEKIRADLTPPPPPADNGEILLADLNLSTRARNVCRALGGGRGAKTVADLAAYTAVEVWETPNCGVLTLSELRKAIGKLGYAFAGAALPHKKGAESCPPTPPPPGGRPTSSSSS